MGELDQCLAGHQAVGVENHHIVVGRAPAAAPVGDVARLLAAVDRTAAVIEARTIAGPGARGFEGCFLVHPDIWVGGITQDEDVQGFAMSGGLELLQRRQRHAEDTLRRLVVGAHEDGGSPLGPLLGLGVAWNVDDRGLDAERAHQEAGKGGHEGERQPGDIDDEERHQGDFKLRPAANPENEIKLTGQISGQRRRANEDEGAPEQRGAVRLGLAPRCLVERPEILQGKPLCRVLNG